MKRFRTDLLVAAAFAVLAIVFLVEGRGLPFESRGIPGPGLFPFLLSVTILGFSAVLTLLTLRRPARTRATVTAGAADVAPVAMADDTGIDDVDEGEGPPSLFRSLGLWALVLAVSVSLPVLGFLPAMLLLTGVLLVGMERRRDIASLVTVVAVPVAIYLLFAALLDVRLPTGIFD